MNRSLCGIMIAVVTLATPNCLFAQKSTTVQLPTFQFFGVGTTVLVPDRGATFLGGIQSARQSQDTFGTPLLPFRNRAIGSEAAASNVHVTAWIHDFETMDEMLLGRAAQTGRHRAGTREAFALPAPVDRAAPQSVAAIRREARQIANQRDDEARRFLAKARSLRDEGKPGAAKIYFQMALRRAESPLKEAILTDMRPPADATAPATSVADSRSPTAGN